jgi:hypothetical protein
MGSLALGFTAWGVQNNDELTTTAKPRKTQAVQSQATTSKGAAVSNASQVRAHRNVTTAPVRQRTHVAPQTTSNAVVRENNLRNHRVRTVRERNLRDTNQVRARTDLGVNRDRNVRVNRERNLSVNAQRNLTVNRNRNVTVNNNWRGARFSGQQYAAFRNYHREWHDRNWWTSHHNRIVFVLGGPYFWDSGYWYPAWGYYPGYSYPYDGPIYGYNDLSPDQVVENVQLQLQRDGYYAGPIDGVLGPNTRRAIAAFQADHGLAITSTVDEPTVETLGLAS